MKFKYLYIEDMDYIHSSQRFKLFSIYTQQIPLADLAFLSIFSHLKLLADYPHLVHLGKKIGPEVEKLWVSSSSISHEKETSNLAHAFLYVSFSYFHGQIESFEPCSALEFDLFLVLLMLANPLLDQVSILLLLLFYSFFTIFKFF